MLNIFVNARLFQSALKPLAHNEPLLSGNDVVSEFNLE